MKKPLKTYARTLVLSVIIEMDGRRLSLEGNDKATLIFLNTTFKNILDYIKKERSEKGFTKRSLRRIIAQLDDKCLIVKEKGWKTREFIYKINPDILKSLPIALWTALGIEMFMFGKLKPSLQEQFVNVFEDLHCGKFSEKQLGELIHFFRKNFQLIARPKFRKP